MRKYRIELTVAEERLADLLAKFLPVEDLSLKELAPVARKPKQNGPRPGVSNVIIEAMSDGKAHGRAELETLVSRNGYARVTAQSALWKMRRAKAVMFLGNNTWKLNSAEPRGDAT